jgi:hypothetical protein
MRLKEKCYRSIVRPTMLYGLKCWVVDKKKEQREEMRMLR